MYVKRTPQRERPTNNVSRLSLPIAGCQLISTLANRWPEGLVSAIKCRFSPPSVNHVGRREQHDVESLKREYSGNLKGPDLLAALVADCPKRSFSLYGGLQSKVRELSLAVHDLIAAF